jgi:protein TonB
VQLDLAQLRNGSIVYSPATADVVFQMEVVAGEKKLASESVRVLRTRPSPTEDTNQPAAPSASPANVPAAAPDAPSPVDTDAAEDEEPRKLATPVKPFKMDGLSQRLRPVRPEDVPEVAALPAVHAAAGSVAALNLGTPSTIAPPAIAQPAPEKPAKLGGQIQQAQLVSRVDPVYPPFAKASGAKGVVELVATVGIDGKVKSVRVVRGHPLLQRAAIDAVMKWVYRPTLLNGAAVETQTQVYLNFVADPK